MTWLAKVVEDSIHNNKRLGTLQLRYPRFIHAEFMTHRVFSRNASSSRAIPVAKMIEQVRTNPAMPIHWGKNQPGMQAREHLDGVALQYTREAWFDAARATADIAERMMTYGAHKQVANRILEPFQWINVVVTATEWDNFFELRDHPDAQPEIQYLAGLMRDAMQASTPVERPRDRQLTASWHLPYVTEQERAEWPEAPLFLAQVSAARCARTSYNNHDGSNPSVSKDIALYHDLVGARPLHASPVEHQGYPMPLATQQSKNFVGWRQHRELVEHAIFSH